MKFGNKGKLSFAIGISDVKSFILQILALISWNEICLFKKVTAITIIIMDVILIIMIIRVYMLPDKKDLRKVRPTLGTVLREKTTKTNKTTTNNDDDDDESSFKLKEYFKTSSKWNIAIDVISVLILIVELLSVGIEKAGILSCGPKANSSVSTIAPMPN